MVERLLSHEARLWHWAINCVNEKQNAVYHRQHAFDLATKIGVSRCIDDIDAIAIPADCGVFREDRDTTFLFLVVRVHDSLDVTAARFECARLLQHLVDEGSLTMVDVGDNGDIANLFNHDE